MAMYGVFQNPPNNYDLPIILTQTTNAGQVYLFSILLNQIL